MYLDSERYRHQPTVEPFDIYQIGDHTEANKQTNKRMDGWTDKKTDYLPHYLPAMWSINTVEQENFMTGNFPDFRSQAIRVQEIFTNLGDRRPSQLKKVTEWY